MACIKIKDGVVIDNSKKSDRDRIKIQKPFLMTFWPIWNRHFITIQLLTTLRSEIKEKLV